MRSIWMFSLAALLSCNGCREQEETRSMDYQQVQEELVKARRRQHQDESKEINSFIRRRKWPVKETGTGLRYWIYEKGSGEVAVNGKVAVISYSVELLDGTRCYQASDSSPSRFRIGQDNVESGLHELLLLMRVGDRARAVLPSHLAFGLTGDADKVPGDASVVYDIHLIALE